MILAILLKFSKNSGDFCENDEVYVALYVILFCLRIGGILPPTKNLPLLVGTDFLCCTGPGQPEGSA